MGGAYDPETEEKMNWQATGTLATAGAPAVAHVVAGGTAASALDSARAGAEADEQELEVPDDFVGQVADAVTERLGVSSFRMGRVNRRVLAEVRGKLCNQK